MSGTGPARVGQDPKHRLVLSQHLSDKMMHTMVLRDRSEPAQQRRSDATQVLAVSHDDSHLGTPGYVGNDCSSSRHRAACRIRTRQGCIDCPTVQQVIVPSSGGERVGR